MTRDPGWTAPMPIYFLSANSDADKVAQIERSLKEAIPDLTTIASIQDVGADLSAKSGEPVYVLIVAPAHDSQHADRLAKIAARSRGHIFFILVSDEISASDYKRLVRTGGADWVSTKAAANEIRDIIARRRISAGAATNESTGPVVVSLVPSAGGVGNSTLAIELAIQLKRHKTTRERSICLVDLDFQTSHLCDYLDIEPRLQIEEIANDPDRLDSQLFDIFVSHHPSNVDVIAAPRSKFDICGKLDIESLDALFEMIATRFDLVVVDLPVTWFAWTPHVIAASEGVIVTGVNTIPGLRQVSDNLTAVRKTEGVFGTIAVALNRCDTGLFGQIARRQHVESVIGGEKVFYVRNDKSALESINVGTPLTLSGSRRRASRDIAAIVAFCSELKSSRPAIIPAAAAMIAAPRSA
jgi:pilus assembly protein CpaE